MSEPLTAGDMIAELQKVPADTVLKCYEYGQLRQFDVTKDGNFSLTIAPPIDGAGFSELMVDSTETAEVHSDGSETMLTFKAATVQPQPSSEPHSSGHVHPAVLSIVGVLSFLALAWVIVKVAGR